MASGYVTSDGKDLDSRYLGINAKAASAKVADSATTATTATKANSATTATTATKLSGGFSGISLGTAVKFSIYSGHSSYKVPKNGVVIGYADTDYALTVSANGVKFIQDGRAGSTVVKAGWTVDNSSSTTFTGTFYPFV